MIIITKRQADYWKKIHFALAWRGKAENSPFSHILRGKSLCRFRSSSENKRSRNDARAPRRLTIIKDSLLMFIPLRRKVLSEASTGRARWIYETTMSGAREKGWEKEHQIKLKVCDSVSSAARQTSWEQFIMQSLKIEFKNSQPWKRQIESTEEEERKEELSGEL